jgi:hypothetical protein
MNLIVTGVSEQAREDQNPLGDPRLVFGLAFLVIGLALEVRRLRRSVVRNPIEFQE